MSVYSSSAAETEVILYRPTCPNMAFTVVTEAYAHLSLCPVQIGVKETEKAGWLSSRK